MTQMYEDFARGEGLADSFSNIGGGVAIEPLTPRDERAAVALLRSNLADFPEAGTVLAATFRRIENLSQYYCREGSKFYLIRDVDSGQCIGTAGIGPMAGLPPSEGVGEVRDMVVDEGYRSRGLGRRLLERCIEEAKAMGYKRIYLETTPQMEKARRLFSSFGFIPVQQKSVSKKETAAEGQFPCYFVLDLSMNRPEDIDD